MDEKRFGKTVAALRKDAGLTQDEMAARLHVSPQAVSKWENGRSLPETALLPALAALLNAGIDELFATGDLAILEAQFGDGVERVNVARRLGRLVEGDALCAEASAAVLGVARAGGRASFLTVKYRSRHGVCFAAIPEGGELRLAAGDMPAALPAEGLRIVAGCYGTRERHYDAMPRVEHYRPFNWDEYRASHETFPSDPANDETEYLTLVYLNQEGLHMATCAEGESLALTGDRARLVRRAKRGERFLSGVPMLPPFGEGMECSWAAALTAALQAMSVQTDYAEVMGNSGACYRLAFCSPGWDYSAVDGLVAYDYATPGFAAYGYAPEMHGHIEKADRPAHRERILKEIRGEMPVLGINLRVAPEWGVLCGYKSDGEALYCRTKFDRPAIEGRAEGLGEHGTLQVENWPFLLCYFTGKRKPPEMRDNLIASLRVFADCFAKEREGGYYMGERAYAVWAADLRDRAFYESCGDDQFARRFSVDQFCTLALFDARRAARDYLGSAAARFAGEAISRLADRFAAISDRVGEIHRMLDSGEALFGEKCRAFWTEDMRLRQADALDDIARMERAAHECARRFLEDNR